MYETKYNKVKIFSFSQVKTATHFDLELVYVENFNDF